MRGTLLKVTDLAVASISMYCIFILAQDVQLDIQQSVAIFGIGGVVLLVQFAVSPMTSFGPSFVLLLYTTLSQFGWLILALLFGHLRDVQDLFGKRHLYLDYLAPALSVSFLACAAFIIGWRLQWRAGRRRTVDATGDLTGASHSSNACRDLRSTPFGRYYSAICMATIYVFAISVVLFVQIRGLLALEYSDVKEAFGSAPLMAHLQRAFWVAVSTLPAIGNRRDGFWVLPPLMVAGFILLASGNRNDILYPLAAGFGIYVLRYRRIPVLALLGGVFVLFVVNPWLALSRKSRTADPEVSWRVVEAIAELGGQIQPFTLSMSIVGSDSPHMWGASLLIPTAAILTGGLLFSTEDFVGSTFYIPNLLGARGHFGQGFSMVAELWVNFGALGTIASYCLLGGLFARLETRSLGPFIRLGFGALTVLMVYWARNSLQFNVTILVYFVAIYLASVLFAGFPGHQPRRSSARDAPLKSVVVQGAPASILPKDQR